MAQQYVRALFDFSTTIYGEISLHCGDVALLLYKVDNNWGCGKLRGQVGNFPLNFVEPVEIPQTEPEEKLFYALEDFPAEMSGDLPFKRGDVIVGMKPVDRSWYHGRHGDMYGMFPVTHVRELETALPGEYMSPTDSEQGQGQGDSDQQVSPDAQPIAKGYANMDLEAQYSGELSFNKGDVVSVIKMVDSDFAVGKCNGALGTFPVDFLDIFEGEIKSPVAAETKKSKFRWWEEDSAGTSMVNENNRNINVSKVPDVKLAADHNNAQNVSPAQVPDLATEQNITACQKSQSEPAMPQTQSAKNYPYSGEDLKSSTSTTNTATTALAADAATLAVDSVPYNKDLKTHRRTGSYTMENTRSYDSSVTPYGKTLFPFVAENPNELSFFDNEIVTLIQHVDDQWIEGQVEGRTGIFPASFIEVIVDCPWMEDYRGEADENAEVSREHYQDERSEEEIVSRTVDVTESQNSGLSALKNAKYGRMRYAFSPDNTEDLSFKEGDVIMILRQVDEHWFEVQVEDGKVGFCPVDYVERVEQTLQDAKVKEHESEVHGPIESVKQSLVSGKVMNNQNGIIQSDRKLEELKQSDGQANQLRNGVMLSDRQVKPGISAKPKPSIKPKPQLKPKPGVPLKLLHNNNNISPAKSPGSTAEAVSLIKPVSPVVQRASSCESFSKQSSDEGLALSRQNSEGSVTDVSLVKSRPPQRPSIPPTQLASSSVNANTSTCDIKPPVQPPPKPSSGPVFVRTNSFTMSSNLDTIIEDQMKAAKAEAEIRSRSSSMLSNASSNSSASSVGSSSSTPLQQPPSIPPRKCDLQKQASRNYGALRELQSSHKQQQKPRQEKKVAMSTFYVDSSSSVEIETVELKQGQRSTSRGEYRQVEPPKSLQGGKRPVPQRKAPPRPGHVVQAGSPGDLMAFSPDGEASIKGSSDPEQTENSEVVGDLDRRIREIEDDIQAYTKNKNELERFLFKHQDDTEEEKVKVKENLDFTLANIQGLTEELNQLRENLYQLRPERKALDQERESQAEQQRLLVEEQRRREEVEKRHQEEEIKRRRETRTRVIQELVQTEKDYLRSITVCHDTFFDSGFPRHPQVEMEGLFGNMEEVIDLSQTLLSALEQATQGIEFEQQKIGECFVMLKKDMTRVYAPYCKNHDDVLQLLEKYEENPEIQQYLQAGVELIKKEMAVFDLGSVLIKPVQRILKYPLLLNELIKNTEEDHPDKFHLLGAITCMTQVAAAINEFKRRKDLVRKYKAEKKEDLGDKLARLNVHSTKKKLSRLSQKMVGTLTIDETFKSEERKFKNLESALRTLVRNVSQYMDHIQESTSSLEMVANDLSDYYAEKGHITKIERYCQVTNHIATKLCYKFRQQLEMQVIHPLNRLLVLFVAPNKVIKKRHDKLLDYDNIRTKTAGPEVEMAKKTYEALNAQLLDELPQLYRLCVDLIQDCLVRLVGAQKQFHEDGLNEMYKLLGIDLVLNTDEHVFLEHFLYAHIQAVERLSDLSFIPKSFNPKVEEKKGKGRRSSEYKSTGSNSPVTSHRQSESQRAQLIQQYPADRVYSVTQDYIGGKPMDLSISQGWLVAVLKEGDPMGNKDRWFVDNGVDKGFVPKTCLTLRSPQKHSSGSFSADLLSDDTFMDAQCKSPALASKSEDVFDPFDSSSHSQSALSTHYNPAGNCQSGAILQPGSASFQSSQIQDPNVSPQRTHFSQSDRVSLKSNQITELPDVDADFLDDQLNDIEYYQAIYPFIARNDLEVSLTEGHYVKVIEKHDLDGNDEWWLVEVEGHQGYAPANYIEKV